MITTAIWDGPETDLGRAFAEKGQAWRGMGGVESTWLNGIRTRAQKVGPADLTGLTDTMLDLLQRAKDKAPELSASFSLAFEDAMRLAYPASALLLKEIQGGNSVGTDDTINAIDRGMVRQLEDLAVGDAVAKDFQIALMKRLRVPGRKRTPSWASSLYEEYGEALLYLLLRQRGGACLHVRKIPEGTGPSPDFECIWARPGQAALTFYLELKSLDVVGGASRRNEALSEALDASLRIEQQLASGKRIAMTERPLRTIEPSNPDPEYDSYSVRHVIEAVSTKAAGAFKSQQFKHGPTFAVANVGRLGHVDQGPLGVKPTFWDAEHKVNLTGQWWSVAYGSIGSEVHRVPEFEGASSDNGKLRRDGLLVDPAVSLGAAGLVLVFGERSGYRMVGFRAPSQPVSGTWSPADADAILGLICDAWNDQQDTRSASVTWRGRAVEQIACLPSERGAEGGSSGA